MIGGYLSKQILKQGGSQLVGASATNTVISDEFRVTSAGALNTRIDVVAGSVTVGTGITAKLQHAPYIKADGTADWVDSKTVAIAGNGLVTIKLLATDANDHQYLPLRPHGRVVLSTGAGDTATITDVRVVQET